jgi:hypothetical protein
MSAHHSEIITPHTAGEVTTFRFFLSFLKLSSPLECRQPPLLRQRSFIFSRKFLIAACILVF